MCEGGGEGGREREAGSGSVPRAHGRLRSVTLTTPLGFAVDLGRKLGGRAALGLYAWLT